MLRKSLMALTAVALLAGSTAACDDDDDDMTGPVDEIEVQLVNEHIASITMGVEDGAQLVIAAGAEEPIMVDDPGVGASITFFAEFEEGVQDVGCTVTQNTSNPEVAVTLNTALVCRNW